MVRVGPIVGRSRRLLGAGRGQTGGEQKRKERRSQDRKCAGFGHESILSVFLLVYPFSVRCTKSGVLASELKSLPYGGGVSPVLRLMGKQWTAVGVAILLFFLALGAAAAQEPGKQPSDLKPD